MLFGKFFQRFGDCPGILAESVAQHSGCGGKLGMNEKLQQKVQFQPRIEQAGCNQLFVAGIHGGPLRSLWCCYTWTPTRRCLNLSILSRSQIRHVDKNVGSLIATWTLQS